MVSCWACDASGPAGGGGGGGGVINGAFFSIASTASVTSGDGAGVGADSFGTNAAAIAAVGSNVLMIFAGTPAASE